MVIPLGNDTQRRNFPYLTIGLIVVNTIAYIYLAFIHGHYRQTVEQFGFVPGQFSILTLFTSMFLHADPFHLFWNMFYLWIYGGNVEDKFGRVRYLIFYLISGIIAHGLQTALSINQQLPTIGASGAIAGVMGAYFVLFPRSKIKFGYFFFIMFRFFSGTFQVPAWLVLGFWFAQQILAGAIGLANESEGGVAFFAHIGGFLCGMGVMFLFRQIYVIKRRAILEPVLEGFPKPEMKLNSEQKKEMKSYQKQIKQTVLKTGTAEAIKLYEEMLSKYPESTVNPDSLVRIAETYTVRKEYVKVIDTYQRLLRNFPDSDKADNAIWFMGEICQKHWGQPEKAEQCYQIIVDAYPLSEWYNPAMFALEQFGKKADTTSVREGISRVGFLGRHVQYSGPVFIGGLVALVTTTWMAISLPQKQEIVASLQPITLTGEKIGTPSIVLWSDNFDSDENKGWLVKNPQERLVSFDTANFKSPGYSLRVMRNRNQQGDIHPVEILSPDIPIDFNQPYQISMDMLCNGVLVNQHLEFGHINWDMHIVNMPVIGTHVKQLYQFNGNIRPIDEKKLFTEFYDHKKWNHVDFSVDPSKKIFTIASNQKIWTTVALDTGTRINKKVRYEFILPLPNEKPENDTVIYLDNIEIYGTKLPLQSGSTTIQAKSESVY